MHITPEARPPSGPRGLLVLVLAAGSGAVSGARIAVRPVRAVARPLVVVGTRTLPRRAASAITTRVATVRADVERRVLRGFGVLVRALVDAVLDVLDPTDLVVRSVDLDAVAEGLDVDAVVARADLDAAVARVDLDAVVDRLDLDEIAARLDVDRVVARVDLDAVLNRIDVDAVVARADLDAVLDRIDLQAVVGRVDLDAVVARVDLDAIAARIDLDAIAARIDPDAIVARVDIEAALARVDLAGIAQYVIDAVDLPEIVRQSTGTVANEAVRGVRAGSVNADEAVARFMDRVLRRSRGERPVLP